MSAATLFAVPEPALNPGTLYEETLKTVDLIKETPEIARSLGGLCALALKLALEADNLDMNEKAYARVKVYDSLAAVLDKLYQAVDTSGAASGSQLAAVLDLVINDTADPGSDL